MRIPNDVQEAGPWRIREIVPDFELEDTWDLPVHGRAEDFQAALDLMSSFDPANADSLPTKVLWGARDLLGKWFSLGRISVPVDSPGGDTSGAFPVPGTTQTSLSERLPDDLRGTTAGTRFNSTPFVPLYRTDDEWAAEISNRTVHGVMHLAWVDRGSGEHQGRMSVYVKPRGALGQAYMAFIKPFRLWIVYPAMMRKIEHDWAARRPPATG